MVNMVTETDCVSYTATACASLTVRLTELVPMNTFCLCTTHSRDSNQCIYLQ